MEKQFLLFIGKTFFLKYLDHRIIAANKAINNTNSKDRPKKKVPRSYFSRYRNIEVYEVHCIQKAH